MNTAKIIYLDDYHSTSIAKSGADKSNIYTAKITNEREASPRSDGIETSDLYGDVYNNLSHIPRVLALLDEGSKLLLSSSNYLRLGDEVSSDNDIQHFFALLPELFCCRSIGDGFASIINSIYNAIINHSEIGLLSENQISKILLLLKRLQAEPFLDLDDAIDLILLLDEVGLNIKPQHLNKVSEILCGN